ncbi:MAG: tRNA-dihydrouridine synthase family protein, partial [Lentisphaeria bacterium]|nr:tRNA-dihydrouridine synthase family protein [Lentisphaeria bacterium]
MKMIYPKKSYIMAPLADYTDLPFRQSMRRQGAEFLFTQMIDSGALVWSRRSKKSLAERNQKTITRGASEPWLGVQLLGNVPEILKEAVEILNEQAFDVLDLNMGCPMKKVTKRGCGAAMCDDTDLAQWCLETLVKTSRFPVTAKTRIVNHNDIEANVKWAKQLEATGIQALTVHGRTREAIYAGEPAFESLKAISEALDIQVIANGGIMSAVSSLALSEKTGIDCQMVARGAIGNPWIFREFQTPFLDKIAQLKQGGEVVPKFAPSSDQICEEMKLNFKDMVDFHGEEVACRVSRKLTLAYLKGRGYSSTFRDRVGRLNS